MNNRDKSVYLERQRARYRELTVRASKTDLIEEVSVFLGISWDHAIRCLNGRSRVGGKRPGPNRRYGGEELAHLKRLYFLMWQPCSKRFKKALPAWIPSYEKHFGGLSEDVRARLLAMSPATIDRLLRPVRAEKGLSTTQAPTSQWYKAHVPIRAKDWNVKSPGHLQGDTVAHSGPSAAGLFASTLTLTDIDSGWTENTAVLGKDAKNIRNAIENIEKTLPFIVHSMKFDSGSEFMNYGVISFLNSTAARKKPIEIYRSRPYRKNDNCYVEQKNFTHVRELFGYDRVESRELVVLMNEIYRLYWNPLQNHFLPQMKLLQKCRIGARIKKTYDEPKTPYQRLLESTDLNEVEKQRLRRSHDTLDPIELQRGLETRLRLFFDLVRKSNQGEAKAG